MLENKLMAREGKMNYCDDLSNLSHK